MRVNVWGEECGGSTARIAARLAARREKESEKMAEGFEAWREQQEIEVASRVVAKRRGMRRRGDILFAADDLRRVSRIECL